MAKIPRNVFTLLLLLIIGSIFGSLVGHILSPHAAWLNYGQSLGLKPTTLNLSVFSLTFGFNFKLNVAGIIGFMAALFLYSQLRP